ncbi:DUF4417 domain-containing protein [Sphingomonas sp.]|jgi:hypothetical protein|uniref:DUF4417 domain-containing protein n=1 Tax=Sphingomonas sp. TaxID=28214 RepID=UPI001833BE33|nr:DUF4417 domain-containing protein [Sphingomonas sp.]MBA3512292.1 DUF4417 domain-containing protein [Sphingomonas sp.]
MMSLGCTGCPDLDLCGGQTIAGAGFNCLDHCCGKRDTCQIVCPNAEVFVDRLREVEGLDLATPQAAPLAPPTCPVYLPMFFHGSGVSGRLAVPAVAIPLYRFFDRTADCRFNCAEDASRFYHVESGTALFLSGVAQDHEVERWWMLEARGRIKAIRNLRRLGVAMVTTPNFSLMVDRPRWDDMHSMTRIAQVFHELISEGQPAALHVNGRTRHDFVRWADYIVAHPEVTHIAYEFTTGAKSSLRMLQHAAWLIELAGAVGRRLGLVVRGGAQIVGLLSRYYELSYIDSSPFEKAQHREIAMIDPEGQRRWLKRPTSVGEPVDSLLYENIRVSERWFQALVPMLKLAA